jgi:hypothetical protein
MRFNLTRALLTAGAIAIAGPAARAATAEGAIPPVTSCEGLANADLTHEDAQVTSTAATTREGHAYCDVKGYITL